MLSICIISPAQAVNVITEAGLDSAQIITVVRDTTKATRIVDIDSTDRDAGDILIWKSDAAGLVWGPYDTSFAFDITSFTENISNTVLIGADAGNWLAIGGVSFSAAYDNGPPSVATVNLSNLPAPQNGFQLLTGGPIQQAAFQ